MQHVLFIATRASHSKWRYTVAAIPYSLAMTAISTGVPHEAKCLTVNVASIGKTLFVRLTQGFLPQYSSCLNPGSSWFNTHTFVFFSSRIQVASSGCGFSSTYLWPPVQITKYKIHSVTLFSKNHPPTGLHGEGVQLNADGRVKFFI